MDWHIDIHDKPNVNEHVLICKFINRELAVRIGYYGSDGLWHYGKGHTTCIIGWMNLPDPSDAYAKWMRETCKGIGIT